MGLRTPQRTVIHTCVCCIPRCCSVSICITCMGETACNANILTTNTVYDSCTCQKLPWNFNKSYLHHQWQTSLSWNHFKVYTSLMLTSWKSSITTPAVHRSIYKIKPNLVTSKSWIREQHYDQLTRRVSSHGLSYKGTNYWKMLNCLNFMAKLTYKLLTLFTAHSHHCGWFYKSLAFLNSDTRSIINLHVAACPWYWPVIGDASESLSVGRLTDTDR